MFPFIIDCDLQILGSSIPGSVLTVSQYFINLYRAFNLHNNARQVIFSAEESLVALQLCVATINKEVFPCFTLF